MLANHITAPGCRATKMTVHLNLFGGTVLKLGTERHHHLLEGIDKMQPTGCFALTELGESLRLLCSREHLEDLSEPNSVTLKPRACRDS